MDKRLLLIPLFIFLFLEIGFGLTKYGDAEVKKGKLIIVRDGRTFLYDANSGDVPVLKNDVLRVGKKSYVVLNTVEDTRIKMGANAVFQIRPWKQRKKIGYLRMLYGKIIFKTKKLLKKRRKFKIKTATATIGVKGTEGEVELTANSNLQILSIEGEPTVQGRVGPSMVVPVNTVTFSIGGREVRVPIVLARLQQADPETGGLDKVPPGNQGSVNLNDPGIPLMIGFTQEELDASKKELVDANEGFDSASYKEPLDKDPGEPDDGAQADVNKAEAGDPEVLDPNVPLTGGTKTGGGSRGVDIPDVSDQVDNARQQSLIRIGRMKPNF